MTDKILSIRAKRRIGSTKKERSDRMAEVARKKWAKISKAKRKEHALKMRAGRKDVI